MILIVQVCFGSMQHEIVVFQYEGPAGPCQEEGEILHPDGLPFSRSALVHAYKQSPMQICF